jgi:hypothetical protein
MRKVLLLPALLTVFAFQEARAAHYGSAYVIPVAGRVAGANGTFFRSDVSVQNFQSTPLTVQALFVESGFSAPDNVFPLKSNALPDGEVTIAPGGSVRLVDLLNGYRGRTDGIVGAIVLAGSAPFAVTSRSYTGGDGGTVGQTVLPIRDFLESATGNTNAPSSAYIPGLISNDRFRSNIGFVAAADSEAMLIDILVRNGGGVVVGQRSFLVPSGTAQHMQFTVRSFVGSAFDIGSAEVRITSGDGSVAPYASVVDNRTGDGVYVSGTFAPNVPFSKMAPANLFDLLMRLKAER